MPKLTTASNSQLRAARQGLRDWRDSQGTGILREAKKPSSFLSVEDYEPPPVGAMVAPVKVYGPDGRLKEEVSAVDFRARGGKTRRQVAIEIARAKSAVAARRNLKGRVRPAQRIGANS